MPYTGANFVCKQAACFLQADEKPKKKKIKLLAHDVQTFNDDSDVYVWIYDPTPFMKKLIGFGIGAQTFFSFKNNDRSVLVLGTIGACLFPLWPDWLRLIIYYASLVGIGLFGLLLGVAMRKKRMAGGGASAARDVLQFERSSLASYMRSRSASTSFGCCRISQRIAAFSNLSSHFTHASFA